METRRMCPHCRAFISSKDKVCPYCHEELSPRRESVRAIDLSGASHTYLTFLILTINAGFYLVTSVYSSQTGEGNFMSPDVRTLVLFGAKVGGYIFGDGQWWRLITAGFLHGGLLHILMNSWVLFDLGVTATAFYGTARLWVIYFASTAVGFLASAVWAPNVPSIGASAGLSGLIGAMIAIGVRYRSSRAVAIRQFYSRWFLYILIFGLMPGLNIDNAAHLGGLAGGFGIAYLAGVQESTTATLEKVWQYIAYACVAVTLLCFLKMYSFFVTYAEILR